ESRGWFAGWQLTPKSRLPVKAIFLGDPPLEFRSVAPAWYDVVRWIASLRVALASFCFIRSDSVSQALSVFDGCPCVSGQDFSLWGCTPPVASSLSALCRPWYPVRERVRP